MIEPKGVDSFQMPNRLKILMASNNDWVVPASADERRYFVLDVPDTRKGDKAYFTELAAAIEGDELAAFLDYLLKLDLAGFDHRNPPHTEGLNKQKLIGAESFIRYWHDCLAAGYLLNTGEDNWPDDVVCQVLHAGYVDHAHQHGDRHPLTINQLGMRLRQLSPAGLPHQPAAQAVERHHQAVAVQAAIARRSPQVVPGRDEDRPRRPRMARRRSAMGADGMGRGVARLYAKRREALDQYVPMWVLPGQDGPASGQDGSSSKSLKNKAGQDGQDGRVTKTVTGENTGAHIAIQRHARNSTRRLFAHTDLICMLSILSVLSQPATARLPAGQDAVAMPCPSCPNCVPGPTIASGSPR